jgi:hypothetical protein
MTDTVDKVEKREKLHFNTSAARRALKKIEKSRVPISCLAARVTG